jgi:Polyketide cyclase / dehydrase and lipid transport
MPRPAPTYRFRSTLYVDLAPGRAYDLLEDIAAYPSWWPQVRSVAKLDEDTALVAARSLMPYTLHFALSPYVRDRAAGTLEAALDGDLVGLCRWDITGSDAGSRLEFAQQVTTPGRVLQAAARVARPVLVLNHRWMMRGARRGLAG